jgi:hypothetical protein
MNRLDGTRLKIIRAKEQIEAFYREVDLFWQSEPKPCEIIQKSDSKKPNYAFVFQINELPPRKWGVIVGEITYNLRSALDHLAWQLALLTTQNPSRKTEFPIFNDASKFNNPRGQAKLQHIPIDAQTIIESLQPYHSGNWPPVECLWWLHEINRVDKHREIVPCFPQSIVKFSNMPGVYRPNKRLSDGEVITFTMLKGTAKAKIGAEIAFDIPTFEYPFPASRLAGIHKFVSEEVIPRFEVFFH